MLNCDSISCIDTRDGNTRVHCDNAELSYTVKESYAEVKKLMES